MSQFDKTDYDKMTYKVYGNKKSFKDFPDFSMYVGEFVKDDMGGLDPDMVFRYLCFMYDPNSPFHQYQDLNRRKAHVLELFNIVPPYEDRIDLMLRWQNKGVNKRAVLFMLVTGGEKYALWQHLLEKQRAVMDATIVLDDKDSIMAENTKTTIIKATTKELTEAKRDFLNGEKNAELERELMHFTLKDTLGIRPEEYVRAYEMTGNPFPEG